MEEVLINDDDDNGSSPPVEIPTSTLSPTPSEDVLSAIKADLELIQDNKMDETFAPPVSRLARGALEEPLTLVSPNFYEELMRLSGSRLDAHQLQSVAETGKFLVPSQDFPGESHCWETNHLLQKGRVPTWETLTSGVATAVELWIEFVPNRLWRADSGICVRSGLWSILSVLWQLPLTVFGGVIRESSTDSESEVHNRSIVTSVTGIQFSDEEWKNFLEDLPASVTSVDGMEISLRLIKRSTLRATLEGPLRDCDSQWDAMRPQRRAELAKELVKNGTEGLGQRVADEERRRYREVVYAVIRETLPAEGAKEVLDCLSSMEAVRGCIEGRATRREEAHQAYIAHLRESCPVRSRISDWLNRRCTVFLAEWDAGNPEEAEVRALIPLLPPQQALLLQRHLDIRPDVDAAVERSRKWRPAGTFDWDFRIWSPKRWIITRDNSNVQGLTYFRLSKHILRTTTTYWPFWRIRNIGMRIGFYINNGGFYLLANSIYGPFGFRSMVGLDDFQPDRTIDDQGNLVPTGSTFSTWLGRIANLWSHISETRHQFERAPDRGFFGKGFVRPFHLFWNYVAKGFVGTMFALIFHPLLFCLNFAFSVLAIISCPVWAVLVAFVVFFFSIFIFDVDTPKSDRRFFPIPRIFVGDFLLKGLGQTLLSIGAAAAAVVGGGLVLAGSSLRWLGRRSWDKLMHVLIIRHKARVPATDGFLTRRVGGPGLGVGYWQVVGAPTAVVMVQRELEVEQMKLWRARMMAHISAPLAALASYYSKFHPVGLGQLSGSHIAKRFSHTQEVLEKRLNKAITERNDSMLIQNDWKSSRVRLTRADLWQAMAEGEVLARAFVEGELLRNATEAERRTFWRALDLIPGDYTALCAKMLERGFTAAVLQPVEEAAGLQIKVEHLNASKYAKMLVRGTADEIKRDDLTVGVYLEPALPNATLPAPRGVFCSVFDIIGLQPPFEPWLFLLPPRA